jgi:hypothetical protein
MSKTEEKWVISMDCDRTPVKYCRKWESVWIVTEHISNTAEKWESAWIVTEHLSNTAKNGI